jgi:prevent-host-death family protein
MRTVSARDANQKFSKPLAEAEKGREIVITRRGVPVARLVPVAPKLTLKERERAIKRMIAMMEKGFDLGGLRFKRDELYDR